MSWHARASALPHWPAPVSVTRRVWPSRLAKYAWAIAELSLWLPVGAVASYLNQICAGVPSARSSATARTNGVGRQSLYAARTGRGS